MLRILSASLRLSALRHSSSPSVLHHPRYYSESSSQSTSPVTGLGALSASSVGLGVSNYAIAILSDKPVLRRLQDQLFPSSLRAIQSLPQLNHSSAKVKGAFLICAGPHDNDMHCTARVFQGNRKGVRKYIGGVHFFLDGRSPTFRHNRNNLKWTPRTFESQQGQNRVTILYDASRNNNSNSKSSK